MEGETVCKVIPIELWGIIAQHSSSSVRCIMRSLNKYFKNMIETKFKNYKYKLSYKDLLNKASQPMFDWCIKCAFPIITEKLVRKHSIYFYKTLISENALNYIKQLYDLTADKFSQYYDISIEYLRGHIDIIKFFVERKCIDGIITLLYEDAAEYNNLDIMEYLTTIYNFSRNFLIICARKAAYNGSYETLKYLLDKGCNSPAICKCAAKGGNIECLELAYRYNCITKSDLDYVYSYLLKYDKDKSRSIFYGECYQFMQNIYRNFDHNNDLESK